MVLRDLHPMHAFGVVSGVTKLVRVTRLESRLAPAVPFPHKHAFFHLLVITAGRGWHEIDFARHPVKPGTMFLMKPAQVHSWQLARETAGYVLEFVAEALPLRAEAARAAREQLVRSPDALAVPAADWTNVTALCQLMLAEYERRGPRFELTLRSALTALLLVALRDSPGQAREPADVVGRYQALVDEHYRERHDVAFYAKRLGLGAKALTMRVHRATGKPARALIQDRLLLESKRLLAYSDLPVAGVAAELGFDDPAYFGRFFRAKARTSPGRFRGAARSSS